MFPLKILMLKTRYNFPSRGQKSECRFTTFRLGSSGFEFLECGDYLNRTDCQLGFRLSVFRRLTGEGRTNYQERI